MAELFVEALKLQKFRIQGGSIVRSALSGKPKRFVELPIRMLSLQAIAFFWNKMRIPDVESRRELHVVSYRTGRALPATSQILDGRLTLFVIISSTFPFKARMFARSSSHSIPPLQRHWQ